MTGPKYRKPPVIEALCELSFTGSQWDDTVPGQFYDRIKGEFPERRQKQLHQADLTISPAGQAVASHQVQPRIQFVSVAGDRLVQLAPNLLVINQLPPYPQFQDWEPTIYRMIEIYRELTMPSAIVGLAVRYINRVVIPALMVRMEDYFMVYPQLPSGFGDEYGPFVIRVEIPSADSTHPAHRVLLTFGTAPQEGEGGSAYTLDIYDILKQENPLGFESVAEEIKAAQVNVERAFEGSITDRLRDLFEPEENS